MTSSETIVADRLSQVTSAWSPANTPSSPAGITLPCIHCGLPTHCETGTHPEQVFCCAGCLGAYQLIHGWGLEDFYALRDQMKLTGAAQAAGKGNRYEQFDQAGFLGPSKPVALNDGTCRAEFAIHGLHCGACAWLIENAAAREPGLLSARVKMSHHTIGFVFDPAAIRLSQVARLLDRLGYGLAPIDPQRDDQVHQENRRLLIQIAIAGFFAANAMWIAIALYAGDYSGVEAQHRYFLGLIGTALGVAAVAGPGRTFFVGALASLRTWTPHMDLPVALGLSVGTLVGSANAIAGRGHVYFDSLAALVFFLLIGRWIQFRQQQRAARAVDLMLRITPRHASLVVAPTDQTVESEKMVLVDTLQLGDLIRVAAGEHVPADGQVVQGKSNIDRSLLTGESQPMPVGGGDAVAAGTINLTSPIDVRVTATGRESRIGRVMQSVEAAATEKTPIVQLADRIGGVFVVTVTLLALVTFAYWSQASLATATAHATALLIVACPCALALATPLAIAVGLGRAAKRNILVRDGQALQQLSGRGVMWFDKTGTLTEGRQRVSTLQGSVEGLRLAAGVEASCRHPVAQAIVLDAHRRGLALPTSARLDHVASSGVVGEAEQQTIYVGNRQHLEQHDIVIDAELHRRLEQLAASGESPILIAVEGVVVTLLGLSDPVRCGALELIAELGRRGWSMGILSGDHPQIVSGVAQQLGLAPERCFGGLSPEEKLAAIRESRHAQQTVVMVGDGANDAAALAAADVGIALRGGAEVSLQAAPVFIASGQLSSLVTLLRGAKATTRLVLLNFALSLGYNLVAVGLAMSGWISPLIAALLMPLSSVSVLALTLAWRSFEETTTSQSQAGGVSGERV
ncbi:MAG: heavy metal translocating P-type ATPase metal-binding domain-containing protein [Planctomycetales bacterium]|nr:heavy metal translocating P-type ATPase metal-binding domain-containing protein [Planctomycetales bacterium]